MKVHHLIPALLLACSALGHDAVPSASVVAEALEQKAADSDSKKKSDKKGKKDKKKKKTDKNAKQQVLAGKRRAQLMRTLAKRIREIDGGAAVDEQTDKGVSTLMLAAALNEKEAVAWLLDKGADPLLKNAKGKTAADLCSEEEVAKLIRAAAPPANWDELIALLEGHTRLVEACTQVKNGGDINAEEGELFCVMTDSLCWGGMEREKGLICARFFISQGADLNVGKGRILSQAVFRGYHELVRLLLEKGADPVLGDTFDNRFLPSQYNNLISRAAWSADMVGGPLDRDPYRAYAEVIRILLQQEAIKKKIEQEPEYLCYAAAMAAALASRMPIEAMLPAFKDSRPLDRAFANCVSRGQLSMCEFLASKGVSPAGFDKALDSAAQRHKEETHVTDCLKYILENGKPTQQGKDEALKRIQDPEDPKKELLIKHGAKAS